MLPHDDGALVEVADVGAALALGVLLEDHPPHVRVEQALADGVGVLDGVGVAVVRAVVPRPPAGRTLDRAGADGRQVDLEGERRLVRLVRPEAMVAWRGACQY